MADKLTPKQEKFAQNVAKGMSKKDAAKQAGYSEKNAGKAGTVLTSKDNPMVQKRISELQEKAAEKAELSLGTHLKDLKDIRDGAMRNNAFSAAVTAEVARGKAAGLYVNRSELTVNRVDTMSKEEVLERMKQLYYDTGGILPAGKVIEVEPEEIDVKAGEEANVTTPSLAIVIASAVVDEPRVPPSATANEAAPVNRIVPSASGTVTVRSAAGSATVKVVSNASSVAPSKIREVEYVGLLSS